MPANRRETGALVEAGKATRFKPGQSGNPSGRPSSKVLSDELWRRLAMRVPPATARSLRLPLNASYAQAVAVALVQEATRGNVAAFKEIADRLQGRVPQAAQFDGETRTMMDLENDGLVVQKLLGASDASDGTALYAQRVAFVRTSRDEKSMIPGD